MTEVDDYCLNHRLGAVLIWGYVPCDGSGHRRHLKLWWTFSLPLRV